jgi:cell division protein FtsA
MCLTNIIKKLETTLKSKISQVYVGVGGQSIRSMKNVIVKEMETETVVTHEMVNELMDNNRNMSYPEQEILDAATQEYKVDQQYQLDPVGIQCSRLEGNFLNILWRKSFYRNLNKCFDQAGIAIAEMYLAPLAMADSVLTETEKRAGCVLVDLGADTTTVSVYYKNILRHLAVIPLGSNNITKDIATLQMEETDAERMKLKYGSAYTDNSDIDNSLSLSIDQDRSIMSRDFINIVEGRLQEIIENVWFQVPNEYIDKLLGGIIITGGGSNMRNIESAFRNHTHIDKIRVARFITTTVHASQMEITAHNGMMNTVLGLLEKGDMNCAGEEITGDLFGGTPADQPGAVADPLHKGAPRPITEISGKGIVQTEEEKKKAEEEARRKRDAEEAEQRRQEEEEAERLRREKRENSFWNKLFRGVKKFGEDMIKDEE